MLFSHKGEEQSPAVPSTDPRTARRVVPMGRGVRGRNLQGRGIHLLIAQSESSSILKPNKSSFIMGSVPWQCPPGHPGQGAACSNASPPERRTASPSKIAASIALSQPESPSTISVYLIILSAASAAHYMLGLSGARSQVARRQRSEPPPARLCHEAATPASQKSKRCSVPPTRTLSLQQNKSR